MIVPANQVKAGDFLSLGEGLVTVLGVRHFDDRGRPSVAVDIGEGTVYYAASEVVHVTKTKKGLACTCPTPTGDPGPSVCGFYYCTTCAGTVK